MIIDILEWDLTYDELVQWISTTGASLHALSGYGNRVIGQFSTKYEFENESDYMAFKLAFQKEKWAKK